MSDSAEQHEDRSVGRGPEDRGVYLASYSDYLRLYRPELVHNETPTNWKLRRHQPWGVEAWMDVVDDG